MYPDAATIEQLAFELNNGFKGSVLKSVFSTSKTDLYFVFNNKKGFKVQFFQGQGFFQFPDLDQFPLKNRKIQFESIHSQKVVGVISHINSRSFHFEFENGQRLVFKLFGKFSNVILFDENPLEIFCLNHQKDLEKPFSNFITEPQLTNQSLFQPLTNPAIHILKQSDNNFQLSITTDDNSIGTYQNITDALNDYTRLFIAAESFKTKKQSQVANLDKQVNQKQKLLTDIEKSIETIKQKRSYGQLGDLLMANLHSIHLGTARVEVFDFYNNSKISIKIKSDLSPQQNASLFYQKAKNEVKELEYKQKSLGEVTIQLEKLKHQLEKLKEADSSKKLKSLNEPLVKDKGNKEKLTPLPYRAYTIGVFEVLVGKNAKANDELLSKYANKNDTWFHAKDVSGSHVIIKNPSLKPIPNPVLEQAASLAAWYSKAKNNSLASVIYTLRKYVRKPKGSPPGMVIVERETGILVKPSDFRP
ncbi:MAG: NFACT RNA binding domain-containing protein [Bacteroidia bacterium]